MSDAEGAPCAQPYPAPASAWQAYVRAARPTAMWVCVVILFAPGVLLPLAWLWDASLPPMDWKAVSAFVLLLWGLGEQRSRDKKHGVAT